MMVPVSMGSVQALQNLVRKSRWEEPYEVRGQTSAFWVPQSKSVPGEWDGASRGSVSASLKSGEQDIAKELEWEK